MESSSKQGKYYRYWKFPKLIFSDWIRKCIMYYLYSCPSNYKCDSQSALCLVSSSSKSTNYQFINDFLTIHFSGQIILSFYNSFVSILMEKTSPAYSIQGFQSWKFFQRNNNSTYGFMYSIFNTSL